MIPLRRIEGKRKEQASGLGLGRVSGFGEAFELVWGVGSGVAPECVWNFPMVLWRTFVAKGPPLSQSLNKGHPQQGLLPTIQGGNVYHRRPVFASKGDKGEGPEVLFCGSLPPTHHRRRALDRLIDRSAARCRPRRRCRSSSNCRPALWRVPSFFVASPASSTPPKRSSRRVCPTSAKELSGTLRKQAPCISCSKAILLELCLGGNLPANER